MPNNKKHIRCNELFGLKLQILKYVGIFGSIQGLNLLIGLLRGKLVAVLLGPGGMGLSSLLNTAVTFLSNTTNLGIGFSAVRSLSEKYSQGQTEELARTIAVVRRWSLIAAILGFVVTIAAAPIINRITFSWGNHTLHYLMLAPTVALLAITGGETAILKATRRIRNLVTVQLITVILSLIITVPIYYFWGQSGIVPVIFLTALTTMLATVYYSYRQNPSLGGRWTGTSSILKLGLSFVIAGIMGSGVELAVRAFLNTRGDLDMVGLYYAAYSMAITYPSALLNSLENDYFSRLSAVNHDNSAVRQLVNAQIEVLLAVMLPALAVFMIVLPVAVPLLFSSKFVAAVPMAQVALLAMFLRAASLPMEYISLAKGLSRTYLLVETVTNIATVGCLFVGYLYGELLGMGVGLVAVYILTTAFILILSYVKWQFTLSRKATALLLAGIAILATLYTIFC